MHLISMLTASALAFASCASAWTHSEHDFGNLPKSHVLWGEQGPPQEAVQLAKRASTALSTATTSSQAADPSCTNGPNTRSCWSNGYSIATDFDSKWPNTGVTRSYTLTLTNTTCNPDGSHSRTCLLVNGVYPGPLIRANWGDMLSITVVNNMPNNGTSLHWHGLRQLNTNIMDGVNGLTECPLAPNQVKTYTFQATQFGTTWYHSHYTAQYGDGIVGPLIIDGPAASNYDIDMGPIMVNDWYYLTAYQINYRTDANLQMGHPPPPGDTILINGKNKSPSGTGSYWTQSVTPGKRYRLRLINISVDNAIRFSIDNHNMTVMTADFVPVRPFSIDSVMLGIGQRYDVVVTFNQTSSNYWVRAVVEQACASSNNNQGLGIINYAGTPLANPTTKSTAIDNGCSDPGTLVPYVENFVGSVQAFKNQSATLPVSVYTPGTPGLNSNEQNIVVWGINTTAIHVQWEVPTLSYVAAGNTSYPAVANLIELPNEGVWTYWIIQETASGPVNIPHPIHLHGHDFYILGRGTGDFDNVNGPNNLNYVNPTRRDTVMLPAAGWVVIAYPTDNPGAWLMHCHIAWHISEGLGVQFLESKSTIKLGGQQYTNQCNAWNSYYNTTIYKQDDSGL